MKTNKEYKEIALSKLRGNWKPGVIASAVMIVLTLIFSGLSMLAGESNILSLLFTLLQVVVLMPFSVGFMNAFRLILSILTCGIGVLWLYPYMYTAQAAFYEDVKAEYASRKQTAA